MNEKAYTYLKYAYEDKKNERDTAEEHYCELLNKKYKLEQKPIVAKYLNLLEEIEKYDDNFAKNDEILDQAFKFIQNSGYFIDTNEIYFYYGSFMNEDGNVIQVPRNSSSGEYDLYKDVESCKYIKNPISQREEFEANHKVIVFYKPYPSNRDFTSVHRDFLYTALDEGQEVACNKVLSRKY